MFKKNELESNGVSHSENSIDSINGYNENTIFKPSTASIKAAALKQQQFNLSIIDELYDDTICLEFGGNLEVE